MQPATNAMDPRRTGDWGAKNWLEHAQQLPVNARGIISADRSPYNRIQMISIVKSRTNRLAAGGSSDDLSSFVFLLPAAAAASAFLGGGGAASPRARKEM